MRESDEHGSTVDSCTYAEISCEESSFTEDLEGEMTQPRSQFTLPVCSTRDLQAPQQKCCSVRLTRLSFTQCSTLRELVDDLDWAGAPVCITMRSEPPALSFSAHGQVVGDLKVRSGVAWGEPPRNVDTCVR